MVDTHAYFGQPGVFPQFGPQTLMPQSQFGVTPGQYGQQYGQSLGQLIAACLAQQHLAAQLGAAIGQPGRLSPFDGGLQTLGQTAFAPYAAFAGLPGQYAPPIGQIGGWAGYPQPGSFPAQGLFGSPQGLFGSPQGPFGSPQGLFGSPQGLFGSPQGQFLPGLAGPLSGQFSLPFGTSGGWPGRPHTFGIGAQGGFPNLGGQSLGEISAWPPQIASQLLGGMGRSFQPYQAASPMTCVA